MSTLRLYGSGGEYAYELQTGSYDVEPVYDAEPADSTVLRLAAIEDELATVTDPELRRRLLVEQQQLERLHTEDSPSPGPRKWAFVDDPDKTSVWALVEALDLDGDVDRGSDPAFLTHTSHACALLANLNDVTTSAARSRRCCSVLPCRAGSKVAPTSFRVVYARTPVNSARDAVGSNVVDALTR